MCTRDVVQIEAVVSQWITGQEILFRINVEAPAKVGFPSDGSLFSLCLAVSALPWVDRASRKEKKKYP